MSLLADYAITPDVFDVTSYSGEEVCGLHVQALKDVLLSEGMVRDLRGGEWRALLSNDHRPWHVRGKELVRKLASQGRLRQFPPMSNGPPTSDVEWCAEALGTHAAVPLTGGVIVTEHVKAEFETESTVARIDRLHATPWWIGRSSSVSLVRRLQDYMNHLDPILRCANSIMFIDPHLDPTLRRYREFKDLIIGASGRPRAPTLEVHRVCYEGSGGGREILQGAEVEQRFRATIETAVRSAGLRVEVFVWDQFHDRFLISNLVGISMPNGFDTSGNPRDITRWTRLGRADLDDVQREFDPVSRRHDLRHRFLIE
jgi:hypothetical protein